MDPFCLSVQELRRELAELGLPTGGRKVDLIERLNDARSKDSSGGKFELTTMRSTSVHEIKWTIDWSIIEQVKSPKGEAEAGEMLESAPCMIRGHGWGCYLEKMKEEGFLSFYVYGEDAAHASYRLYIKNKSREWVLDQDAGAYSGGWSRGWGWRCWKKISGLRAGHVIDGKVHLQVRLSIYGKIRHESKSGLDTPPSTLRHQYARMLESGTHSDATLVCESRRFKVHKCVLASASAVFRAMFRSRMCESLQGVVTIQDVDSKTLESLVKYMYTEDVRPSDATTRLLFAADKYKIDRLAALCMANLQRTLSVENILEVFVATQLLTHVSHCGVLRQSCFRFFSENAMEITSNPSFAKFTTRYPEINKQLLLFMANMTNPGMAKKRKKMISSPGPLSGPSSVLVCAPSSSASSTRSSRMAKRRRVAEHAGFSSPTLIPLDEV